MPLNAPASGSAPAPGAPVGARSILYVQYTNPAAYPPLQHSACILADAGWRVLMLGAGTHGADALVLPSHRNVCVRVQPYRRPGWRQKLAFAGFVLRALVWALRWRAGWIYASDPFSAPAALAIGFLLRRPVVYHEHDSPNIDPDFRPVSGRPPGGAGAFMQVIFAARRRLARRAVVCVLPNQERALRFKREAGTERPVVCVWNCPARAEAGSMPGPEEPGLVLFYHGSLVPARLPAALVHALALLPAFVRLHIAGYETIGHRGYMDSLCQLADRLGAGSRMKYLGPIPSRSDLLQECRRAHIGLAFMPKDTTDINERFMTGASNKPFDYLACGLALLVSDLPDWRTMFVDSGCALACDPHDPDSIARTVAWFGAHPRERAAMGAQGRAKIQGDWNYETQFERVRSILEGETILNAGRGAA